MDKKHTPDRSKLIVVKQMLTELEIGDLHPLLDSAGIEFLVLKGPHLGNTVYPDPLVRVYQDLDILVRPKQYRSALTILMSHGYKAADHSPHRLETARIGYHAQLTSPRGLLVELHRYFSRFDRYPVDTEQLFAQSVPFRIGGVQARGLCPKHLVVHLVIHVLKSYFRVDYKHFLDIALVTKAETLEWGEIVGMLESAGAAVGAFYVLMAARKLCEARIPDDVLGSLRPGLIRRVWLDRQLSVGTFPVYRGEDDSLVETRFRLALPLIDSAWRWPRTAWKYATVRMLDFLCYWAYTKKP